MPSSPDDPRSQRTLRLPDGRRLGYADLGDPDGTPVLYFHGTPGSRFDVLSCDDDARACGVRLVAADRPGIGLSDWQEDRRCTDWPADVAALADGLGIDRFAVVGLSGGSPYVAVTVAALSERITAAGIVSGSTPPDDVHSLELITPEWQRFSRLCRERPATATWWQAEVLRGALAPLSLLPAPVAGAVALRLAPPAERAALRRILDGIPGVNPVVYPRETLRGSVRGFVHDVALESSDWGVDIGTLPLPVHVWQGACDRGVLLEQGEYLARRVPGAVLTVWPEDGHLGFFRHLHEVLAVLTGRSLPDGPER